MEFSRYPQWTTRTWLAVLVLVCSLPLWGVAGFLLTRSWMDIRATHQNISLDAGRLLALQVDGAIERERAALEALAVSPSLGGHDIAAFHRQARQVAERFPGCDIVLAARNGQILMATSRLPGMTLPVRNDMASVRAVFGGHAPLVSGVFIGALSLKPGVGVDIAVANGGNAPQYDLAMIGPPQRFLPASTGPAGDLPVVILDGQGRVVAQSANTDFVTRSVGKDAFSAIRGRKEGRVDVMSVEGHAEVVVFSRSTASDWTVLAGTRAYQVVTTARQRLWLSLAVAVVVAGLGLGVALALAKGLARSLVLTVDSARRFVADEPGERPPAVLVELDDLWPPLEALKGQVEAGKRSLAHMARHDSLTGLPNRSYFEEAMLRTQAFQVRHGGHSAALFLDLAGFRAINDTYGRAVGDEALKAVAGRVATVLRTEDFLARWGGDEFAILAPIQTETPCASAHILAQRILAALHDPVALTPGPVRIRVSIGLSVYPACSKDIQECLRLAEESMYRAKKSGKQWTTGSCACPDENAEFVCPVSAADNT